MGQEDMQRDAKRIFFMCAGLLCMWSPVLLYNPLFNDSSDCAWTHGRCSVTMYVLALHPLHMSLMLCGVMVLVCQCYVTCKCFADSVTIGIEENVGVEQLTVEPPEQLTVDVEPPDVVTVDSLVDSSPKDAPSSPPTYAEVIRC